MAYTIPVKVYKLLEEKLGKETASVVVEALESSIKEAIKEGKAEAKSEVSEELKKELASKYDIELVRKDMKIMEIRIIAILIIAMILLNPGALEFLARLLGLLK